MKTLQEAVLLRVLGDKGFKSLYEQYCDARLIRLGTSKPSDKQLRLAKLGKELGAAKAGRKAGVPKYVVDNAMNRVARYEWLTK